jgi:Tfp pilus assembly protein PilP
MWRSILELAIEFLIYGGFLLLALWIMVTIQGLQYHWPGLILCAVVASALNLIPFVGRYLAGVALLIALKVVTREDFTGVVFTAAVSFAATFCMKLFLLGALLPDAHLSDEEKAQFRRMGAQVAARERASRAATNGVSLSGTNRAKAATNAVLQAKTGSNTLSVASAKTAGTTNHATVVTNIVASAPSASTNSLVLVTIAPAAKTPVTAGNPTPAMSPKLAAASASASPSATWSTADSKRAKANAEIVKSFYLKGIIRNASHSMAMIDTKAHRYSLEVGESKVMDSPSGRIMARLEQVNDDSVTLNVGGEEVVLTR